MPSDDPGWLVCACRSGSVRDPRRAVEADWQSARVRRRHAQRTARQSAAACCPTARQSSSPDLATSSVTGAVDQMSSTAASKSRRARRCSMANCCSRRANRGVRTLNRGLVDKDLRQATTAFDDQRYPHRCGQDTANSARDDTTIASRLSRCPRDAVVASYGRRLVVPCSPPRCLSARPRRALARTVTLQRTLQREHAVHAAASAKRSLSFGSDAIAEPSDSITERSKHSDSWQKSVLSEGSTRVMPSVDAPHALKADGDCRNEAV